MSRYGASTFSSLLKDCVLWAPLARSAAAMTAKTITANGNATQSTAVLDPWGLARPVGYFDGNGDYLTTTDHADWYIGTSDFTIECNVYLNSLPIPNGQRNIVCQTDDASNRWFIGIHYISATEYKLAIMAAASGSWIYNVYGTIPSLVINSWNHFAISRSNNVTKIFVNGTLITTTNTEGAIPNLSGLLHIGAWYNPTVTPQYQYMNGYLSEVRISNTARYTNAFTPSTTRFKPDAYTKLLLHMYGSGATFTDDPFIDVDEFPILPSGVTVTNNGTFTKTDLGNNKSVLNFDGSTNRITFSDSASFTLGTNAFSLVMWVNLSSVNTIHTLCHLFAATNSGLELYTSASAKLCLKVSNTSTAGNMVDATGSSTLEASTWYHIAVTRSGSTFTVYINAISDSTGSSAASIIDPTAIAIGCRPTETPDQYHYGTIKDVMLINGKALSLPEIKLLMARTHPITGAGLMPANGDYWRTS